MPDEGHEGLRSLKEKRELPSKAIPLHGITGDLSVLDHKIPGVGV